MEVVEVLFTPTETVGLLGTEAQYVHLDFHIAPEVCMEVGGKGDNIPITALSPPAWLPH